MCRRIPGKRMPFVVWALLGALLAAPALWAQQSEESSVLRLFYQQKELVTAASRVPEEARTAPATVDVFSREDILNMGARTLSDLLRTLESVYVSTQTNAREYVWIRGIRNRYDDKVLLLIDGVPRRDLVYEHASIDEYLPLTDIERVEVIRGPGSALYGTNAFAGVINVVTRRPLDKPGAELEAGGGDFDTKEGKGQGWFKSGDFGLYGYVHYFDTKGDGLDYDRHQYPNVLKQNPKTDQAQGLTLTWKDFTFQAEAIRFDRIHYTDWDVPTWRWKDEGYFARDSSYSAQYAHAFSKDLSVRAILYYQHYDEYNFWREFLWGQQGPNSSPADVHYIIDGLKRGHRMGGEVQFTLSAGDKNQIVTGLSLERESLTEVRDYWYDVQTGVTTNPFYIEPVTLNTWAVYAQDTWKPSNWATVTIGVRGDHHGVFGWKVSPRLGVSFHPGEKLVVKLLYGEAFRAPSAREFYTVDDTGSFPPGNPQLKPERIQTLEAGLTYTFSSYVQSRLVIYQEKTSDAIFSENDMPYINHGGDIIKGLEANLKLAWPNHITAYVNYSYTKTDLYNVPHNLAHAGLNLPFADRFNWNLDAESVSSRPRDPKDLYEYDPSGIHYHRPDVPGYVIFNTTFRILKVWKGLEVNASIYNLLNKDCWDPTYEPTKYYDLKNPNRTYLVRVVYRF